MPFNMEGMVRGIGELQATAMENLWNAPQSGMLSPGSGIGGGGAMLEPGAGISGGGGDMLEPGFGPFGRSFAGEMLSPDMSFNRDSSGMTAMADLQSLKSHVSAEADRYDAGKVKAAQESLKRANQLQVANQFYNTGESPSDNTQSAASTTTRPVSGAASTTAGGREVEDYITQAASARGIDPNIALRVAKSEGGTETARRGTFKTGSSWWPFQLHYGGKGYEQLGTTAGMGNTFTPRPASSLVTRTRGRRPPTTPWITPGSGWGAGTAQGTRASRAPGHRHGTSYQARRHRTRPRLARSAVSGQSDVAVWPGPEPETKLWLSVVRQQP